METDYYKQPSSINWSLTAGGQNVEDTASAKQIRMISQVNYTPYSAQSFPNYSRWTALSFYIDSPVIMAINDNDDDDDDDDNVILVYLPLERERKNTRKNTVIHINPPFSTDTHIETVGEGEMLLVWRQFNHQQICLFLWEQCVTLLRCPHGLCSYSYLLIWAPKSRNCPDVHALLR